MTPSGRAARRARSRAAPGRRDAARAGAGAGRCRHRQDPRDHPPDRLRRGHRGLRADRGAGGDVHHPGGGGDARPAAPVRRPARAGAHLPLRGAAPAPLLLAARPRHRAADPHRVEDRSPGHRRAPAPAQHRPGAAARPRLRGRVGQGQQRPSRRLRRLALARGRSVAGLEPRPWAGSSAATRRSSAARAGWTWRTCCCSRPGLLAEDERVAAQVRRQYKWFVVDEFQDVSPLQSALLDLWLGRSRRAVRGRRPGADDLLVRRRRRAATSPTSRPSTPTPPRSSWSATTAPRRRWSTAANPLLAGSNSRGVELRAQRPAGPEVTLHRTSRRGRRGGGRRRPASTSCATPAAGSARSRCCSGSTRSPRPTRRR